MKIEEGDPESISYLKKSNIPKYVEMGLESRNLTKNQASIILGVDRSYFTHLLKGECLPSVDMAKRIALLLGFDWQIFFVE